MGNFSEKFKSRCKDVHLSILSRASLVNKYDYKEILTPLNEEFEIISIKVSLQGVDNMRFGSFSTFVADNLPAYALGSVFQFLNCLEILQILRLPQESVARKRTYYVILRTKRIYGNHKSI